MAEEPMFISTRPATAAELRWERRGVALSIAFTAAVAPFASQQWVRSTHFIVIYDSAMVLVNLMVAALLSAQFLVQRARPLLLLVAAYVFAATMACFHLLTFPGLFASMQWLGAGPQTTAWLYFAWYSGVALLIAGYRISRQGAAVSESRVTDGGRAALGAAGAGVAAAVLLLIAATAGHHMLPHIMQGDQDLAGKYIVAAATLSLMALALLTFVLKRPAAVLDVWLTVATSAWFCQVALEALFNAGRFSVGWYAGRIFGLVASSLLLVALIIEGSAEQLRLVESLQQQRRQQQQLRERDIDLLASRESESLARDAEAKARQAESDMRRLAKARLESRERERRRLARDLHDDMGQALAGIKMQADSAGEKEAAHKATLKSIATAADVAMTNLRGILADLRPPLIDEFGFEQALETLLDTATDRTGIMCSLELVPPHSQLPEPYATTLFRVVQESLTNIARHADASKVEVEVRVDAAQVHLRIHDDGKGFDPALPARAGSSGIEGMRERAEELGGSYAIESETGRGTTTTVSIPLEGLASGNATGSPPALPA